MPVSRCTNSTITEAYALIGGLPGPLDRTDAPSLLRRARVVFVDLARRPMIVVAEAAAAGPVAAFWSEQVSWDEGRRQARFGHRFLSVHFSPKPGEKYDTFDTSFAPDFDKWLELYPTALGHLAEEHLVDRIGFGYVNTFDFELNSLDLSDYFRMNFAMTVGATAAGLLKLNAGCTVRDEDSGLLLSTDLRAESRGPTAIRVVTRVFAEQRGLENMTFSNGRDIAERTFAAKEAAKRGFFGFVTEQTRAIMGAEDDAAK